MNDNLAIALSAAVPLWIAELKGKTFEYRHARAQICAQAVAEHGDILQYPSKKKGATADAFNRLAEGLAIGAFQPGGIKFLGNHWEEREENA